MPIYAFQCNDCGHQFEELVQRMDATAPCPKCQSEKVEKQLTAPADFRGQIGAGGGEMPSCPMAGQCPGGTCGLG